MTWINAFCRCSRRAFERLDKSVEAARQSRRPRGRKHPDVLRFGSCNGFCRFMSGHYAQKAQGREMLPNVDSLIDRYCWLGFDDEGVKVLVQENGDRFR